MFSWSGATPSRTRPQGVGSRSIMSTSTGGSAASSAPAAEREQKENRDADEDGVAEPVVEVEAVVERVLGEWMRLGDVRRHVERAVAGRADLDENGEKEERRPEAVQRPQRGHAARLAWGARGCSRGRSREQGPRPTRLPRPGRSGP